MTNVDLGKSGPLVVEVPPGAIVGMIDDFWQSGTTMKRGTPPAGAPVPSADPKAVWLTANDTTADVANVKAFRPPSLSGFRTTRRLTAGLQLGRGYVDTSIAGVPPTSTSLRNKKRQCANDLGLAAQARTLQYFGAR